jgi:pyruvate/2-oxoglutarate dehydrogenase complex dihydrolipoamide acyltransferase (E2) component
MTSYLTFGPIRADGQVQVVIVYDHRVMDGRSVARCVQDLGRVLHGEVLDELHGLARAAA